MTPKKSGVVYLSIHLSIHPSIHPSIYPSIYTHVCIEITGFWDLQVDVALPDELWHVQALLAENGARRGRVPWDYEPIYDMG